MCFSFWCKQSGDLIRKMFIYLCALLLCGAVSSVLSLKCDQMSALAALEDHNTVVETNLKLLSGTWISEGCETRPGPEYVLRSYSFEQDGSYYLIQHHYWDDSCSSPKWTVLSYGRLQLRNSLIQPGAYNAISKVTNISVIPQDNNAAKELDRIVATECPGQLWKSWRRYEEHTIYDSSLDDKKKTYNLWASAYEQINNHHSINNRRNTHHSYGDISCLGSIKWAFNELKLLKIQLRPVPDSIKKRPRVMKIELLLGDIHSNPKHREFYSPTSFQVHLTKQSKGEIVSINRHTYVIKTSNTIPSTVFTNGKTPPHLIEKPHLPPLIWGEWVSSRCEIRPMGLYLTRKFTFYAEDSAWVGEHQFYSDPFCKIPKFTITASGHFTLVSPSREMKGTTNIDFEIERATLVVMDQRTIYEMRLPGFCGLDEWEVNVPKELSTTNGCIQLGIIIPSIQYDIAKVEMDYKGSCLLFLGQVETDNVHTTSRPTAFQPPLVKCGEISPYAQNIINENLFYTGTGTNKFPINFCVHLFFSSVIYYLIR